MKMILSVIFAFSTSSAFASQNVGVSFSGDEAKKAFETMTLVEGVYGPNFYDDNKMTLTKFGNQLVCSARMSDSGKLSHYNCSIQVNENGIPKPLF